MSPSDPPPATDTDARRVPQWLLRAIGIFWIGYLAVTVIDHVWQRIAGLIVLILIALFVAFALEPGIDRLSRRGWSRSRATLALVVGVLAVAGGFVAAMGALIRSQISHLITNADVYVGQAVDNINSWFGTNLDAQAIADGINDPDGRFRQFLQDRQDDAIALSVQALGVIFSTFTVLLFAYYLAADGPRMRRSICSRLPPNRQRQVLEVWELAITKTGGYLYSRLLLAACSAMFHWVVFQGVGIASPIALALWVGVISQFLPVIGTYVAGVLPVGLAFIETPATTVAVLLAIIIYQQIENYLLAPKVAAKTMELHPGITFGAALAGVSVMGFVGALLALPIAAMTSAVISARGARHDVVENRLTALETDRVARKRRDRDG